MRLESARTMRVFNNRLYVGIANKTGGGQVWEYDGPTATWAQVNANGFGNPENIAVHDLAAWEGCLFALLNPPTGNRFYRLHQE